MSEYHAKASPSGSHGWLHCPSWINDSEGSEYADDGTASHTLFAWCLTEKKDALAYKGRRIPVGHRTFEVDADRCERVQWAVDVVRSLVQTTGGILLVERDVSIEHITGEEKATGRSDAVIVAQDEIIVCDLKDGYREVRAADNPQGEMYLLGAFEDYGFMTDAEHGRFMILQPRRRREPDEWAVSLAELQQRVPVFREAAVRLFKTREGAIPPAFNPSHAACEWCARKATCGALARFVEDNVGADFDAPLPATLPAIRGGYTDDDQELAARMAATDLVEAWIKAVRSEVEKRLLAGVKVPGYKLVEGRRGARRWEDDTKVRALFKEMRLTQEEIFDFKLKSPTEMESLLKATPKRWKRVLESKLIVQSPGGKSVAPDTDARAAISVLRPDEDFNNVEDLL